MLKKPNSKAEFRISEFISTIAFFGYLILVWGMKYENNPGLGCNRSCKHDMTIILI